MRSRRAAELGLLPFALGVPAALIGQSQSSRPTPQRAPSEGRAPTGTPLVPLEESWLRWPLPPSEQAYAAIDGPRLKGYVEEVTAISRRAAAGTPVEELTARLEARSVPCGRVRSVSAAITDPALCRELFGQWEESWAYFPVPEGPGLGLRITPDVVRRFGVDVKTAERGH